MTSFTLHPDDPKGPVAVEQVDRNAAAARLGIHLEIPGSPINHTRNMIIEGKFDQHAWVQAFAAHRIAAATKAEAALETCREALHEIDIEAFNTIPPDGKEAAFAALQRIARIIAPFRLRTAPATGAAG